MSELVLHLPLDFEQLPEYWQLREALASSSKAGTSPRQIEQSASFLFSRLMVTLGYQARSTCQPGRLTKGGVSQLRQSVDPLYGDDCNPVNLLESSGLLTSDGDGWNCPLFARLNPHLSANYKPSHIKGNERSRLAATMKNIPGEAAQQAVLLGMTQPEVFKKRNGEKMAQPEIQRCIIMIRTVDRCVGQKERTSSGFSEGLMATALAIVEQHDAEVLKKFYFWLVGQRENPAVGKTTEEVLAQIETLLPLSSEG